MRDNPMGTNGFAFVEFASNDPQQLSSLFSCMGFTENTQYIQNDVSLFQQNDINFFLNTTQNSFAADFAKKHGPSACGMGFKVKDAKYAFDLAVTNGAKAYTGSTEHIGKDVPAIYGIGNSLLYFIDFDFESNHNKGCGLELIDHLTHNVMQGDLSKWANYYETMFNFFEVRNFDIQGKHTGLLSQAMTSPCGKIKIPLNESKDSQSQIAEFLAEYNGEGIQHIALSTPSIYDTVETMRKHGVDFMDTPKTYFQMIDKRLPGHGEDVARMQKNSILIDGGEAQGGGLLLQIFTKNVIGPIFFEVIQRKGNEGFGEGNFQALFDSIELDQVERGVIK